MRLLSLLIAAAIPASAQTPLETSGLPDGAPLAVTASATGSVLLIDLAIEDEWHAYARDVGGGQPVTVRVEAACDFAAAGALAAPGDENGKLEGAVRLRLPLEGAGEGRELRATLELQVCDALECLPPMTVEIEGEVERLSVLLVVAAEDERAGRISGWLRERGFATDVALYESVTAEACDAHDVVVADSDVFRKHGVGLGVVRGFPRTETPIVAVGFLGTELVEGHGVAMTSGYI